MQRYFGVGKKEMQMILAPGDLYHIKTVMRMHSNDQIEVVYNQKLFLCCIDFVNGEVIVNIKKELETKPDFMKHIVLVIPVLKEQKMDFILQKATELGVTEIIPVLLKRCVVKVEKGKEEKRLERWNKILKEASEQSMRQVIPNLYPITTLAEIKKMDGLKMICSTVEENNTLKFFLQSHKNYDKLVIAIGPEGGFDPKEEQDLIASGFSPVTLGPRIMRVETVPIYLLSILNYEYME